MKKTTFYLFVFLAAIFSSQKQTSAQELWGMTPKGGANDGGVIFKYDASAGMQTVVYSFAEATGTEPDGDLLQASNGKLYGLAYRGGINGMGVLFEYNPQTGTYTKKVDFEGEATGGYPSANLIEASNHKLYGMTGDGGLNGGGVLFEYDLSGGFQKLHDFSAADGTQPRGSLLEFQGALYGVTWNDGEGDWGTLFKYDPATGIFSKLHDFTGESAGKHPVGNLIEANGKLYGMTHEGGTEDKGIIYEYDPAPGTGPNFTVIYNFTEAASIGSVPFGSLIKAADGNFYGLTQFGGTTGRGAIFEFNLLNATCVAKYNFKPLGASYEDGYNPYGSLFQASNGNLYGMTSEGGVMDDENNKISYGILFEYNLATSAYSIEVDFDGTNGAQPGSSALIQPTIEYLPVAVCKNTTLLLDASGHATLEPSAIDGGSTGNNITLSASKTDFTRNNTGENAVILIVTDSSGNISSCSATVTVNDNVAPVAVCHDVTVQLDASGQVTLDPVSLYNGVVLGGMSFSVDQNIFNCQYIGENTVTLTVTLPNQIISTCSAKVKVVDNTAPTATCKNATVVLDNSGNGTLTVQQVDNGSTDNCGIKSLVLSKTSFTCSDIATNPNKVTQTVTDNSNNISTCESVVTVVDNTAPAAACKNATVVLDQSGNGTLTVQQVDNGSSDGCGIKSMVLSKTGFSCSDIVANPNKVTLTVTDNNNNVSACEAGVTVVDNSAPTANCKNATVVLDNSGNGTLTVQQVNNGSTDNCGIKSMVLNKTSFSCSDIAVNPNKVILTVTDNNSNQSTCEANVTVVNGNSTVSVIASTIEPVQPGNKVIITISNINSSSVNVDWNDNSSQIYPVFNNTVVASHTYTVPGIFVVTLSYASPCEGTKILQYKYVKVYDPDAGFVTGGGWIMSPAGAYKPDATLAGKANYGFVAKYKKGDEVDGNTEFQMQNGKFKFKSSSLEAMSLIVAGSKAIFSGKGTLNNIPGYSFMVYIIDGDLKSKTEPDRLRIKIWNTQTKIVVYDNQSGADDNIDPLNAIGGGSIVIHKNGNKSAIIFDSVTTVKSPDLRVYPNPFCDHLNIEFVPVADVDAVIEINDITGRRISTIFEGPVKGGVQYNAVFKPANIEPGIYFYCLKIGEMIANGKVVYNNQR